MLWDAGNTRLIQVDIASNDYANLITNILLPIWKRSSSFGGTSGDYGFPRYKFETSVPSNTYDRNQGTLLDTVYTDSAEQGVFGVSIGSESGTYYKARYGSGATSTLTTHYFTAYVPSGANDPNVVFTSADAAAEVMAHINSGPLAQYKGTYAPRNAFEGPDYQRLDLRITQDFNVWNDHKLIVYLDVLNLMNLLDDQKGIVQEYSYNNSRQIIVNGVDAQGRVNITGVDPDDSLSVINFNGQSVWQVNLGFKYSF